MFMIWDSRHEDSQRFWLSFRHCHPGMIGILLFSCCFSWQGDFSMERTLAINYSFQVVIISPHALLDMSSLNNTAVIQTVLVPNDYADFSRNSYGQQTLNAIMSEHGHTKLEVLRLHQTVTSVQVWEVLHFLVADGLMENINQLQLAVIIGMNTEGFFLSFCTDC